MDIEVTPKKWYVVSGTAGATVSKPDGTVIATVPAGGQTAFLATTYTVVTSSANIEVVEATFKGAPIGLGGGGGNLTPEQVQELVEAAGTVEEAIATLSDVAKQSADNIYTGTNKFNGVITANGGISGLPAEATKGSPVVNGYSHLQLAVQEFAGLDAKMELTESSNRVTKISDSIYKLALNGDILTDAVHYGYSYFDRSRTGGTTNYNMLFVPATWQFNANGSYAGAAVQMSKNYITNIAKTALSSATDWVYEWPSLEADSAVLQVICYRESAWNSIRILVKVAVANSDGVLTIHEASMTETGSYLVSTSGNAPGPEGILIIPVTETAVELYLMGRASRAYKNIYLGRYEIGAGTMTNFRASYTVAPYEMYVKGVKIRPVQVLSTDTDDLLNAVKLSNFTTTQYTQEEYETLYPES